MERWQAGDAVSGAALGLIEELEQAIERVPPVAMRGRVNKVVGMLIDASGIQAHVGELCELTTPGERPLLAEVVGFAHNAALLTPLGPTTGISALTEVLPSGRGHACPVGHGLLGRVLNAMGEPMDALGALEVHAHAPVHRAHGAENIVRREIQPAHGVHLVSKYV